MKQNTVVRNTFNLHENDLEYLLNLFPVPLRNHSRRVAVCSSVIAECAKKFLRICGIPVEANLEATVYLGGICHDVGKLLLPALITNQDDCKRHTAMGAELLEAHKKTLFDSEAQAWIVIEMARLHHERPDGSGYPDGLRTNDIPLLAGICSIANELDHLIFYDGAADNNFAAAFDSIRRKAGTKFNESAVICFERAWPQLTEKYGKWLGVG